MQRLLLALSLALAVTATAAPMTVKEIDFLLRQQTPEAEISSQLQQRKLLTALDAGSERLLIEHGASAGFVTMLKQGHLVLSQAEAQVFAMRTAPPSVPAKEGAPSARPASPAAAAAPSRHPRLIEQLTGNLVHLDGDELKPFDAQRLKDVRVFAIYNSAMWCGPCRNFTPKLVEFYKRTKAKHPEFEVLFLSRDRDEFNMANYMRTHRMPWPALRYGTQGALQNLYCGDSIPWLVCVSADGRCLTRNGDDKKYINPEEILGAVEYLLSQLK